MLPKQNDLLLAKIYFALRFWYFVFVCAEKMFSCGTMGLSTVAIDDCTQKKPQNINIEAMKPLLNLITLPSLNQRRKDCEHTKKQMKLQNEEQLHCSGNLTIRSKTSSNFRCQVNLDVIA